MKFKLLQRFLQKFLKTLLQIINYFILNYLLLTIACLITVTLPSFLLDNEVIYLNFLGLGYLALYIFFISKNSFFDLVATVFLFAFGLIFDAILFNHFGFYFYGLVDYPFFSFPPAWVAVLWFIIPLQFYKLNFKYKFIPAGFIHAVGLVLLERRDLVFIEQPYQQNLLSTMIAWIIIYRVLYVFLDFIKEKAFSKKAL